VEGFLHLRGFKRTHVTRELFEVIDIGEYGFGSLAGHGKLAGSQADAKLRATGE